MTPPAASTVAGAGHARTLRRPSSGRTPRRVSGPSSRRTAAPRPARATRAAAPRRVSGPAGGLLGGAVALPRPGRLKPRPTGPLAPRIGRRLAALPEHPWLDRLLTGRVWIALIAIGLIGLVFMQVSLLKLNAGMGAAVQRAGELETKNAALRADVNRLGSPDRIQQKALEFAMVLPSAGEVRYLGPDGRRVGGDAPGIPSQAAATVATLPVAPDGTTVTGVATDPAATAPVATDPATTTTAPVTDPAATAPAPTAPVATAPAPTATPTTTTAPTATATAAPETTASSAASAATGGAAPTGLAE